MNKNLIAAKIINRRRREKYSLEHRPFESLSIGDIAFLLLIFFIVTSSFMIRQGIFFSLPSVYSSAVKIEKKQIIEVYPKNNGFLYEGSLIDRDSFIKILKKHKSEDKKKVLMIMMEPDVKYEYLVDILSIARETGVTKVSLKNIAVE